MAPSVCVCVCVCVSVCGSDCYVAVAINYNKSLSKHPGRVKEGGTRGRQQPIRGGTNEEPAGGGIDQ